MAWLTAAEIAAFLGITPSGVRQIVRRHGIPRRGTGAYKAGLYDLHEVLEYTSPRDRLAS
ncbi:helix-turn-helix domain-containing protein [Actinopolymorpha alba]|uniref:helix-turn-helix domain-containing protein n=1 Tax=Actinopolymorpha alba TaxID=533267 RepID=UPI00037851D8|nr:helix-turn-helix domain-containing protein [Actinopolymorpha alba]